MFLEAYGKHVSHMVCRKLPRTKILICQFSPDTLLTPVQGIVLSQPQKIKLNLLSQAPSFQFLLILVTLENLEFFLCWVWVQILSSFLSKLGWTLFLGSPIINVIDVVSLMNRARPNIDPFRTLFLINLLSD